VTVATPAPAAAWRVDGQQQNLVVTGLRRALRSSLNAQASLVMVAKADS